MIFLKINRVEAIYKLPKFDENLTKNTDLSGKQEKYLQMDRQTDGNHAIT